MQDHSYGDSSGITPDSLLIRPEAEPIVDANVREVLVKSKMKGERSASQFFVIMLLLAALLIHLLYPSG